MSDTTTWAVLGDGRYIRILVNKGPGKELAALNSDNLEAFADLSYELRTGKSPHASGDAGKSDKRSYIQLQADFLSEQHEQKMFDLLVIAAPQDVLKSLRDALPEQVNQLIIGELAEDLLANSADVIENMLADIIIEGRQKTRTIGDHDNN